MNAEDFAINDGTQNKEVENLAASFPDRGIAIFLLALFVEAVDLSDLARLVVTAHKGDAVRVAKGKRQLEGVNYKRRSTDRALRQSSRVKVSRLK